MAAAAAERVWVRAGLVDEAQDDGGGVSGRQL